MSRRKFKLYLPFVAVMVVQGLLAAIAPSDAPRTGVSAIDAPGGVLPEDAQEVVGAGEASGATSGNDAIALGGSPDGVATGTTGAASRSTGGGPDGATSPTNGGATGDSSGSDVAVAGDTSHCIGDRQMDVLLNNPSCKPRFEGDNGGASYQGVTGDTIKIIQWDYVTNATQNSLLSPQGLAATDEDRAALDKAALAFIHKYYELYGRRIELERYQSECTTSPQNVPLCKEEARKVIAMKPFAVMIRTTNYPEIYDEFARAGIITLGGWHWPQSYFTNRRPYRWDLFMDGDLSAQMVAEYYCKKMAGGSATHAGPVVHPSIGGRSTPRRVGIFYPDRDTDRKVAETMASLIGGCDQTSPVIVGYSPDLNEAGQNADGYIQRLIAEDVTTVICFCDPVIPIYLFRAMTRLGYFPENLLSGTGLLDYDKLGRLYDQQQWVHAFGPGHLWDPLAFDEMDHSRMWRATGQPGQPCQACNLDWSYWALMGAMIHEAGPQLTPANVEKQLLNAVPYGGRAAGSVRVRFGPGDYTVVSDARESYWNPNKVSAIDGQPGAYQMVNSPTRYELGEWTSDFDIPVFNG